MGMFTDNNSNTNGNNGSGAKGDFEKAKGFANFYLPIAGGGRVKVGSIPLRESQKGEKAVLDFLLAATDENDLNERMGKLMNKLQFEFNAVTNTAVTLDL